MARVVQLLVSCWLPHRLVAHQAISPSGSGSHFLKLVSRTPSWLGAELFEVPFGVLDGQALGGALPDHALLRLELFYFGDQLRFLFLVAPRSTARYPRGSVTRYGECADFDQPSALIDVDHTEAVIARRDNVAVSAPYSLSCGAYCSRAARTVF